MSIRAIVFDCNGLIADDEPLHFKGLQRALAEVGVPIDEQTYLDRYLALDDKNCIAKALADHGKPDGAAVRDDLALKKRRYYAELVEGNLKIFPGAADFARAAAARYATAIGSGALRPEIDMILAAAGISGCFPVIVSAEEIERSKPAPDCYLRVLEKLRARPGLSALAARECLVLEDSRGGVTAAREADMRVAAVLNSYPADQLAHADLVIPTLEGVTPEQLIARLKG
jgi:HAD superfamily hydrolase (TIGR01509 family)